MSIKAKLQRFKNNPTFCEYVDRLLAGVHHDDDEMDTLGDRLSDDEIFFLTATPTTDLRRFWTKIQNEESSPVAVLGGGDGLLSRPAKPETVVGVMLANRDVEFGFRWNREGILVVSALFDASGDRPAMHVEHTLLPSIENVRMGPDYAVAHAMNALLDMMRDATTLINKSKDGVGEE